MCMMKSQNQRHIVLADMLSCISQLHGVEEIQEDQLGTTIYENDLKDWDKTWECEFSTNKFNDQQNLLSTLLLQELGGQLCPIVPLEQKA